jgi:TM2 domain-containing membrane protein YozV
MGRGDARFTVHMSHLSVAYLLAALSFFGAAGLHRFYLGKPITGLLWFFTGGLFVVGTIYDLVTMARQVRERFGGPALPTAARPALPAAATDPATDLELRLLQAARRHDGRLTTVSAAAELGTPVAVVERALDRLTAHGHAEIEATDDGIVVYDFPALRFARAGV